MILDIKFLLRTSHIPTDYTNPAYKVYKDIPKKSLIKYTTELSAFLLASSGRVSAFNFESIKIPRAEGVKIFINSLMEKFKVMSKSISDLSKRVSYLYIVRQYLYNAYFTFDDYTTRRDTIYYFQNKADQVKIEIKDRRLASYSSDLKEVSLDSGIRSEFSEAGIDKIILDSLSTTVLKEYEASSTLINLQDPITDFGHAIKALSLRFAAEGKKIFIIPLVMTSDGLGQPRKANAYVQSAIDSVKIGPISWRCWILDGSSLNGLKDFNKKYPTVLRAMLEGQLSLHFVTGSDTSIIFEHLGTIDIHRGAIDLADLMFTRDKITVYKVFRGISSFDDQFYNEDYKFNLVSVMNSFRSYPLYILPESSDWGRDWEEGWNKYKYISDFF